MKNRLLVQAALFFEKELFALDYLFLRGCVSECAVLCVYVSVSW
jgi:hypothetical protein